MRIHMSDFRTRLSVNINKIATLRNARGGDVPSVVEAAKRIQDFGADGITVHPRPDERHIRYQDVHDLRPVVHTEFNIEGYPNPEFVELVLAVQPEQVTLVPDPPGVLTSNAGWNTVEHADFLRPVLMQFKAAGIRTSVFMETKEDWIRAAADLPCDRIELYTEAYATGYDEDPESAVRPYGEAAALAQSLGLGINAGHDLNLKNLKFFAQQVPGLDEVSIGHALIADALYLGMENTVRMYQAQLRP